MLIKLYIFYSAPTQIQTETLALSLWIMDCSKLGCQWKPQQMFHLINNIVWMVKVLNIRELKGHQFHLYILRAILYRDYFKRKFYPKMITQSKIKCRKALLFQILSLIKNQFILQEYILVSTSPCNILHLCSRKAWGEEKIWLNEHFSSKAL